MYEKSNHDLLVTQQALRHTSLEMTLYYLETISDNVALAMPNYDFFEFDKSNKMSNSKLIYLSEVARARGKRDIEKRTEDGSQRSS